MSKPAKAWVLILAAGLLVGVTGVMENGWQQPGDTVGAAVWLVLALAVVVMIRRESRNRSSFGF